MRILFILLLFCSFAHAQVVDRFTRFAVACTADPGEIATTANVTSDPNCNETNTTTNFGTTLCTVAVESTEVDTGSYSLKITANTTSAGASFINYNFSVTSGNSYTISYRYKADAGNSTDTSQNHVLFNDFDGTLDDTTWTSQSYTGNATSTGTAQFRIFVDDTSSAAGDGNIIYIDNVSIIAN